MFTRMGGFKIDTKMFSQYPSTCRRKCHFQSLLQLTEGIEAHVSTLVEAFLVEVYDVESASYQQPKSQY